MIHIITLYKKYPIILGNSNCNILYLNISIFFCNVIIIFTNIIINKFLLFIILKLHIYSTDCIIHRNVAFSKCSRYVLSDGIEFLSCYCIYICFAKTFNTIRAANSRKKINLVLFGGANSVRPFLIFMFNNLTVRP